MNIDFNKSGDGLVPAVIQDAETQKVLMLGYMNREALEMTQMEKRVTFYSRTKQRLWTKGETSGHFLQVVDIKVDCDGDTLLVKARPNGPVCHTGADTCFNESNQTDEFSLRTLEKVINQRKVDMEEGSYTASLFKKGINKIAQKVGEEAVETVIEALGENNDELFLAESADLLFHYLVLLSARGHSLDDVVNVLRHRHQPKK